VRKALVFSASGAIVLLAAAAVLRFAVVPNLQQLPANTDTTLHYTGTADVVDQAALAKGDLANAIRSGLPVTADQHVKALSTSGDTAVISDETTVTANGTRLAQLKHIWAVDRRTLAAAPVPAGSGAQEHEGLVVGFPLSPEARDYPYWDYPTQTKVTATYMRSERHADRDTYVYTTHASGPLKDQQVVAGLPTTLPKQVLVSFAAALPPAIGQGLQAQAAQLPDQIPIAYNATADATYWVDRATGYVVDVNQKQTVSASIPLGGATVPLANVFALDLKFTPASVSATSKDAATAAQGLFLLGTVGPAVIGGLGVLGAVLWLLGLVRRKSTTPEAPAEAPAGEAAPVKA
jgi:hypothetical protein